MPRQAAPRNLKVLRGVTPGRVNHEPRPRSGPPEPPGFLDAKGLGYWSFLLEQAEPMGTLCNLDSLLLGLLADALSRADKARELCRRSTLIMGADGTPKRSPANLILKDAVNEVIRLSRELGLSPSVRHGLNPKRDDDDVDRLLS